MPNHDANDNNPPKNQIDRNQYETARIKAKAQSQIKLADAEKKAKEAEENLKTQKYFEIEGTRRRGALDDFADPRVMFIVGPAMLVYGAIAIAVPAVIAGTITGLVTRKSNVANKAFQVTFAGIAGTTLAAGVVSALPTGPQYETREARIQRLNSNIRHSAQHRDWSRLAQNWRSLEKIGVDPLAAGQVGSEIHAATVKSCKQEIDEIDDKYHDYYDRVDASKPCDMIISFFYDEVLKRKAQTVAAAAAAREQLNRDETVSIAPPKPKLA